MAGLLLATALTVADRRGVVGDDGAALGPALAGHASAGSTPLAAFFMAVVDLGAVLVSLYALGYGRGETAPRRVLPFVPAFLAGMNLVLLADDAFTFLLAWEFMSLTSWALVLREHESRGPRARGLPLSRHGEHRDRGPAAVLRPAGRPGRRLRLRHHPRPRPGHGAAARWCCSWPCCGAGSKAGLVPLHVWLPPAHAAAPSHVSALMSGVMTKVAVYAAMRILFDLAGPPAWWWGAVLMLLGAASAVLGLLYALMQNDLKRLLAYSTVENIGIVYIALGFALAFTADGLPAAAAIALSAALLHALNHTLFKSLLFMGAGAVLHATRRARHGPPGRADPRLPVTSACFLVGAAAISALPPLNGFVSEWLLFQAVLVSPSSAAVGLLRFLAPAVGALLALAAALAAACFVRAYGIDLPRPAAQRGGAAAREVDRFIAAPRCSCRAALCVLIGVLPGLVIDLAAPAVASSTAARMPRRRGRAGFAGAGRRTPQLLQRPHPPAVHRDLGERWRRLRSTASRSRAMRRRTRPGTAAIPDPTPAHAVLRQQLRPADAPRVRRGRVPRPGRGRDAGAGRDPPGALRGRAGTICLGAALPAGGVRWSSCVAGRLERAAVPDHPPLSDAGLRRARVLLLRGGACGADPAICVVQASQMLLVLRWRRCCWACTRKVKARLLRRRGPSAAAALPRSAAAAAQGGGAGGQRLLAVPRRALSRLRRRPGWRRPWCRPSRPA